MTSASLNDAVSVLGQNRTGKFLLDECLSHESFSPPRIARSSALTGLLGAALGTSFAYILTYIQIRKTGSGVCTAI